MNEKGLIIEVTSNKKITSQKGEGNRISEIQWVQYNLDMFSSVQEVINNIGNLNIELTTYKGLSYFICDRSGSKAIVEIKKGQPKVYLNEFLPIAAMTNTLYDKAYLISECPELYNIDNPQNSVNRFQTANDIILNFKNANDDKINYAFQNLARVKQDITMFEIVYDLKEMDIYFRSKESKSIKKINLKDIDYSCSNSNISFEINDLCSGNANKCLIDYNIGNNIILSKTAYNSLVSDGSLTGIKKILWTSSA